MPVSTTMNLLTNAVTIVGAATSLGQPKPGVEKGTQAIRDQGLIEHLHAMGIDTIDTGDIAMETDAHVTTEERKLNLLKCKAVGEFCHTLSQRVYEAALAKRVTLTLGGDHSLAIGSIAGMMRMYPELRILWIDAHGDFNTHETSPSGNLHGMPLAFLNGLMRNVHTPGFDWLRQTLDCDRIAFIGLRDLDEGEKVILQQLGITAYSADHVEDLGINTVVQKCLEKLDPHGIHPLYLSFDIDALDPTYAPATGTKFPGGLTFREGRTICRRMYETQRLVGVDMVEVNPSLSDDEGARLTSHAAMELLLATCGKQLL